MRNFTAQRGSHPCFNGQVRLSALAGSLVFILSELASAAPPNPATVNKLALKAYCAVAQNKSSSLADGRVSYKQVADLASHKALKEHPNVYRDSYAWKAKIVSLLDQYGDEPIGQLCNEDPGPGSSAND